MQSPRKDVLREAADCLVWRQVDGFARVPAVDTQSVEAMVSNDPRWLYRIRRVALGTVTIDIKDLQTEPVVRTRPQE